ncbi:uncharacterized mitochondrial protein AtMg00810 [Gossypium hirsutum]|uniref:Uncharacterized mitochondrial protein AtMg00810 n=1 Tax=Gossypium hirsutum TaxID=3635 RepID=A0A1U8KGF0_GOSHI|nr:uncharacterized mitochondrial protein AtMg00810-like [Gossypium hirsutum]
MQDVFEMTDLGLMTYFLRMEVKQNEHGILISQHAFASKILSKLCMSNSKPASTPVAQGEKLSTNSDHKLVDEKSYRSLVGCLFYLIAMRPDIVFMYCYNVAHFKAAKRVLRYVKGTLRYGVKFVKAKELKLVGYSDSAWAAAAVNQAIWLRKLLSDLNVDQEEATEIKMDNQSAVAIAKNPALPIFDVGKENGSGIKELGCLVELGDELVIYNLQNVRNIEEARAAKLWEKKKLQKNWNIDGNFQGKY